MKTIYKYILPLTGFQPLAMPAGAKVLSAQAQQGQCCIWALVDTEAAKEVRCFSVYGTGWEISKEPQEEEIYIGTCQIANYVWHVFEVIEC